MKMKLVPDFLLEEFLLSKFHQISLLLEAGANNRIGSGAGARQKLIGSKILVFRYIGIFSKFDNIQFYTYLIIWLDPMFMPWAVDYGSNFIFLFTYQHD